MISNNTPETMTNNKGTMNKTEDPYWNSSMKITKEKCKKWIEIDTDDYLRKKKKRLCYKMVLKWENKQKTKDMESDTEKIFLK